jgi:hypothetical protein
VPVLSWLFIADRSATPEDGHIAEALHKQFSPLVHTSPCEPAQPPFKNNEALSKQRPFRYNKSYRIVFTLMFAVLFDKNNKLKEWVSLVIEINQKIQTTHFPKAMHYI